MHIIKEVTFSFAKVQLLEPALVKLDIFGDVFIDLEEARQLNDAIGIVSDHQQCLVLITAGHGSRFSPQAMKFSASDEGLKYTIADALVVNYLGQRLTANFYLGINRPRKPTRIFNSEKDAMRWLRSVERKALLAAGYEQMGL
jgi:hypothetical protein